MWSTTQFFFLMHQFKKKTFFQKKMNQFKKIKLVWKKNEPVSKIKLVKKKMNQFKKYWTSLEIQLSQFKNWTITYTRQLPVNKKMSLLKVCFYFTCRVNQMSVEVPFLDPWVRASWRYLCTYSSMFLISCLPCLMNFFLNFVIAPTVLLDSD